MKYLRFKDVLETFFCILVAWSYHGICVQVVMLVIWTDNGDLGAFPCRLLQRTYQHRDAPSCDHVII
jgi:hypothetical protein